MGEILGRKPTFLDKAFKRDWPLQIKGYDKPAILNLAFRGGYPEVLRLKQTERDTWFTDYKKSLLSRDLKDIANIQRHGVMEALLIALSAWSGKLMDVEAICAKLSISRKLLVNYADILILLCLFEKVPAWILTDYDRVGRREKIYATDTGLMAHLLDWREADVLYDPDKSGKMVETFVFNQLSALTDFHRYSLYHYRDRQKREIDFIVKNDLGGLLGIEVKSGSAVSREDTRHLVWFKNNIVKDREFTGIVLYTGETTLPLGQDMYAVPMAALWS
jgi:predicted AAA+ superfamily ATPase